MLGAELCERQAEGVGHELELGNEGASGCAETSMAAMLGWAPTALSSREETAHPIELGLGLERSWGLEAAPGRASVQLQLWLRAGDAVGLSSRA